MSVLSLHKILNESHRDMFEGFDESQLEEQYPESFNFEELETINTYAGKKRYIESQLGKPLGNGSARSVYRIDKTMVLKLAKNSKGIAQNEVEIDWGNDSYYSDILANVYDYDKSNYYWVEMELALKVGINDFKRLWGIDFRSLYNYLHNKYREVNPSYGMSDMFVDKLKKNQLEESDEVIQLVSFMYDTDSMPGDFGKKSSWGKIFRDNKEELVLIDFGLTSDVYSSYYS